MGSPKPPIRRNDAEALKAAVNGIVALGIVFTLIGGLILAAALAADTRRSRLVAMLVGSFLVAPGILYIVGAIFLRARRYWAWVTTLVLTIIALIAVAALSVWLVISMGRRVDGQPSALLAFGCWGMALIFVLRYLRDALPGVRETEANAQHGFAVVAPVAVEPVEEKPVESLPSEELGATAPKDQEPH